MTFFTLYIDPGTGSMLFSLFITLAATATFAARALYLKLKFAFSLGKAEKAENQNIPIVIFSDHKRYWNVFKPICDEAERRGVPIVFYTASADDPALSASHSFVRAEYLGEGNKPYARLNMLHADILVATTPNLDVYQWKRSRTVKWYVHVPHLIDDLTTYRMFALDYYDAVLLNGPHQEERIRFFEKERNLPQKELPVVGSTYMDTLLEKKNSLGFVKEGGSSQKIVLVAPSWGKSSILSRFGSSLLDALCRTGYTVVVRPHPQSMVSEKNMLDALTAEFADRTNLSWNYDNDNFSVLNESDIMITDFSGIIFDYSMIFDKPLIYADTSFEPLPYDADWLPSGDGPWCFKILPELGIKLCEADFPRIKEIIDGACKSRDGSERRLHIRSLAWRNQGNAAKATVDYIVKKLSELSAR
ncbi:MAG: CDP-glycerol glycerophosphotransferase family protein [Treponema sp.]|nr:CDP-glycerol glycerophosphotransferase family protein [Treponema sp.]